MKRLTMDSFPKYISSLYNSIPKKQTTQSKSGKGTQRNISPKKTYRWLTSTWKDIQLHSLFSSVQFSHSVMSDSLWPHESQHARPPSTSTPRIHQTYLYHQWCHSAISFSVVPFSSLPPFLPASGSFPMSQLFAWGGQSIEISYSASVLPMNTQDWSPLE